jgi:hypothetical protein
VLLSACASRRSRHMLSFLDENPLLVSNSLFVCLFLLVSSTIKPYANNDNLVRENKYRQPKPDPDMSHSF